jgi:LuxR family maltose regulon positive regulatory protein
MVGLVGVMAGTPGFREQGNARLDEAERLLHLATAEPDGSVVVVDDRQMGMLPGAIQMFRAALALTAGDLEATALHGRRALDIALEDDHLVRGAAAALVGLAAWPQGDLDGAADAYALSIESLRRAGHIADVLGCSITLADLRFAQGRLRDLLAIYRDGLDLALSQGGPPLRGTADMHVGMSQARREGGDLVGAAEHLRLSAQLGEHNGLPQHGYRSRLAMARLHDAEGDLPAALLMLEEAERVYMTDFSPSVRPIPAVRAGMLAVHGHVDDALAWARDRGLTTDDELDYVSEFEHITLARVLVAQGRADRSGETVAEPIGLLQRLMAPAVAGGRKRAVLQILILLALAEEVRGDRPAALAHLERAVAGAEPEGYARLFLDEGTAIGPLLAALAERGVAPDYIGQVLGTAPAPVPRRPVSQAGLVDPLSGRELDVLRLLGSELSGPEIARELMVSLNTVRTHTKSIYSKLGVTSRRAAVRSAVDIGLLAQRTVD